ncbi:hypothetical protein J7E87_15250 [Streptomyces sp. ISL-1]|uniref:hypothetical protein n=1 Tax=Streptomyces sp. ISL-1 TaxID=2817657 RepID=UPI001BE78557|nr:hypothetical protein [Streptomyces sp. ISL-1]MBT2390743.1 hypothetical protein [Streptomyces sp. ISL-1]
MAGDTLVSRVIGHRGLVTVGVPLAGVRAEAVVAMLGCSAVLSNRGHRGRRRVRMACGALPADTVCVHQCEE